MINPCTCRYAYGALGRHVNWCASLSPQSIEASFHPFKHDDIVTGKDRSYTRSIYRIVNMDGWTPDKPFAKAELISYDGIMARDEDEKHYKKTGKRFTNEWFLKTNEYRLATMDEVYESARGPKCECGSGSPRGQSHSDWCKLFKREF